ncbi:MAG: mismatch-specific DNA-glycosylase [Parvibaculum sp.]
MSNRWRKTISREKLPDVLVPGLDVVFVGTAAGRRSAAVGAYYAHPGNRFWRTLFDVGLTPRLCQPHEFPDLLPLGIGFTDMAKLASGMDHEIDPAQFDVPRFEAAMARCVPRAIAFTSKKAASVFLREPTGRLAHGRQKRPHKRSEIFILTSPSGAATRYWSVEPWRELALFLGRAPAGES